MTVVAIDGPAGAGKSTIARAVADAIGFDYLDTGAMYRAVALAALRSGVTPEDGASLARLASSLCIEARGERVLLDGEDVSERIRHPEVTSIVSTVAAHQEVRAELVARQREVGRRSDVVIEGRDIGATVVPDAAVKIWLTASLRERARRRARELGGEDDTSVTNTEADLEARDAADSRRPVSPLAKAADAVTIDSTGKPVEEVVAEVVRVVRQKLHDHH